MLKSLSLQSHRTHQADQDFNATASTKFELSTSPSKITEYSPRSRFPNTENDFDLDREPRWAFEGESLHYFNGKAKPLKVLVVTWNLHGNKPGEVVEELLNTKNSQHHIIAIATQECLRPIGMSFFNNSKDEWVTMLKRSLSDFELVTDHTLNAIHLAVFARKEVSNFIKEVESAEVATGFANLLGNKGAVGISFKILGNSFLFLSCHLTCGQDATERRNNDFARVMESMPLPWYRLDQHLPEEQKSIKGHFDFIFCAGDLNYRVDMAQQETLSCFEEKDFQILLENDQLNNQKSAKKDLFKDFHEGEIRFAPTYKYELTSHLLDNTKEKRPAWTDRILYTYKETEVKVQQASYDSNRLIFGSDHRPVFSQFVVNMNFSEKKRISSEKDRPVDTRFFCGI